MGLRVSPETEIHPVGKQDPTSETAGPLSPLGQGLVNFFITRFSDDKVSKGVSVWVPGVRRHTWPGLGGGGGAAGSRNLPSWRRSRSGGPRAHRPSASGRAQRVPPLHPDTVRQVGAQHYFLLLCWSPEHSPEALSPLAHVPPSRSGSKGCPTCPQDLSARGRTTSEVPPGSCACRATGQGCPSHDAA